MTGLHLYCHTEPMRFAQGKLREGSGSPDAELLRCAQDDSRTPLKSAHGKPSLQMSSIMKELESYARKEGRKERTQHGTAIWFACSPGLDHGSGTYQGPRGSL